MYIFSLNNNFHISTVSLAYATGLFLANVPQDYGHDSNRNTEGDERAGTHQREKENFLNIL